MTGLRAILEVARRDFTQRARSKVFLFGTLLVAMLILGGAPMLAGMVSEPPPIEVGVVGDAGPDLSAALDANAAALEVTYRVTTFATRAAADAAVRDGSVAVTIDGNTIVWLDETGPVTNALVSTSLQQLRRVEMVEALGLSESDAAGLFASPESVLLEEPDPEEGVRSGAAYAGAILLFMSVVLFGQFVLLGVLEEKSSRVAEVVLSRVRPVQLLAGKVIGIGLLGLAQLVVLGGSILVAVSLIDIADLPNLSSIGFSVIATVVAWYILGFAFYSVWYAAAGSLVSRQEDVQGVGWIPMIGLLPGYFLALVATWNPDELVVRVASMFPATAPMVMPVRASAGDVPGWEIAVAVAVTLVSTYLLVRLAARIYRGGILRSGRIRLRDAWNAATG